MDRERNATGSFVHLRVLPMLGAFGVAIAVLLRATEAHRKSLWLDELHSLWTARGEDLAQVIERVRLDFHPPLYFLMLHGVDGLDPHAQRWVSILFSLATLVPLLAIARSAGLSPSARCVVLGLFATSPYQILYGAELRAYAVLGFFAVTMAWAAFTDRAPAKWRFVAFAAATGFGINVHYFAGIAALCFLFVQPLIRRPAANGSRAGSGRSAESVEAGQRGALPWKRLALATVLGLSLFLPWLLAKERWLLTDPGKMWRQEPVQGPYARVPIDETHLRSADLIKAATLPLRTQVPMLSSLGRPVRASAQVAAGTYFILLFTGIGFLLAHIARSRSPPRLPGGRRLWTPIAAGAATYLAGISVCLAMWKGYPGQYYVIGAWAWPLLGGACVDAIGRKGLRASFAGALLVASLATGVCHVLGNSRENIRGAVGSAVEFGRPLDAIYTAILWQPTWYPHALPFQVYAPDVESCEPGEVAPAKDGAGRAVVVITRDVALAGDISMPIAWRPIKNGRKVVASYWVDDSITVFVLVPD